jgi:transketolase
VPEEALAVYREAGSRSGASQQAWLDRLEKYTVEYPKDAKEFRRVLSRTLPDGWDDRLPLFEPGEKMATRAASGAVLNAIAAVFPELVGGSADLAPSTDTYLKGCDVTSGSSPAATSTSAFAARHGRDHEWHNGPR